MTGNAGKAAKAASRAYEANRARAKQNKALRDSWVLDSEWTAEQHLAVQRDMKAAFYARNPGLAA